MTSKNAYFANLAARLDPRALTILAGEGSSGFAATVPEDTVWWLLNAHWICGWQNGDGPPFVPWEHRQIDYRKAMALPSGTLLQSCTLEGMPADGGFAVVCKPEMLDDPRYEDAETLYYERLDRINRLPLRTTRVLCETGAVPGVTASPSANMDWGGSNAEHFVVRGLVNERASWISIVGTKADNATWFGINCMPEISDWHATSFDDAAICVLPRKQPGSIGFNKLVLAPGNISGRSADATDASMRSAYALMLWSALPANF